MAAKSTLPLMRARFCSSTVFATTLTVGSLPRSLSIFSWFTIELSSTSSSSLIKVSMSLPKIELLIVESSFIVILLASKLVSALFIWPPACRINISVSRLTLFIRSEVLEAGSARIRLGLRVADTPLMRMLSESILILPGIRTASSEAAIGSSFATICAPSSSLKLSVSILTLPFVEVGNPAPKNNPLDLSPVADSPVKLTLSASIEMLPPPWLFSETET